MRKIAHVISTPEGIGGAEKVMLTLLRGGAERGWNQIVINPFDLHPGDSRLSTEVAKIRDTTYIARTTRRATELPGARSWLHSELAAFGPDVLHVHLFHAVVLAASLGHVARLTVLSHHHGDQLKVAGDRLRGTLDRWAGKRFDHVVACSRWVRDFLVGVYGYNPGRVTEIPNGWEGLPLDPAAGDETVCTFVCIANLRPEKGHLTLVEAFDRVRKRHPLARLVLVGDGTMRSEIEGALAARDFGGSVELKGTVDNVWPILGRSDVFVLPSRNETLGMAALEAMAASLPVVATAVGGIPEVVEHGHNGLLVPPRDAEALAAAMATLAASPEMRRRMGSAGKDRAEGRKAGVMVDRYFHLYGRLLEG